MNLPFGTLYYDGTCRFCCEGIERFRTWLAKVGVEVAPFPTGPGDAVPEEMRLRCVDGREFGGADAAVLLVGRRWWGRPLEWLGRLPGIRHALRATYRAVARRRHCLGGACELRLNDKAEATRRYPTKRNRLGMAWGATFVLVVGAWGLGEVWALAGWLRMWLLGFAMWLGFKGLAAATTARAGWPASALGWLGYLLWPGMDLAAFARRGRPRLYRSGNGKLVAVAAIRCAIGAGLLFGLAPRLAEPLATGWCVMLGLVLLLHFGLFDLLAVLWRRVGFDVEQIMQAPWRAASLADFWGARWNRAFSQVANRALFRPLTRRAGLAWGTLAGFALSGLAHELVISVPAGAGYGLPTIYFLVQGLGVLAERRWGWRGTTAGRCLMAVVLLAPAFWLFHPAFMSGVLTPMAGMLKF